MPLIVLADDILDVQICDDCHKYLSAKPVKIGRRKILCGRCVSNTNEELVESQYNILSENILFKCINRFDGCAELLTPDQVIAHETTCTSQLYDCPLCSEHSVQVPSYLFPYHVKKYHKKAFLKKNTLTVVFVGSEKKMFFYQQENYLFFIELVFFHNYISLNAYYIGGKFQDSQKVHQSYLYLRKQSFVETHQRECLHLNNKIKNCTEWVKIDDLIGNEHVTVKFEFHIPDVTQFISFKPSFQYAVPMIYLPKKINLSCGKNK